MKVVVRRRYRSYLANEVGAFLLVLLGDDDGVLPDGVVAFVSLASLELGDDVERLLLLEVLVESEGGVLLLIVALAAGATFRLLLFANRSNGLLGGALEGYGPHIGTGGGTPAVASGGRFLVLSIGISGNLGLQLGGALIAAPTLVNLLLRVAGRRMTLDEVK